MDELIDMPECPNELDLLRLYSQLSVSQRAIFYRVGQALLLDPRDDDATLDAFLFPQSLKRRH